MTNEKQPAASTPVEAPQKESICSTEDTAFVDAADISGNGSIPNMANLPTVMVRRNLVEAIITFMQRRFDGDRLLAYQLQFSRELSKTLAGQPSAPQLKVDPRRWLDAHIKVSNPYSCVRNFSEEQLQAVADYLAIYHHETSDPEQMEKIVANYEEQPSAPRSAAPTQEWEALEDAEFSASKDFPWIIVSKAPHGPCDPNVVASRISEVNARLIVKLHNSLPEQPRSAAPTGLQEKKS